MFNFKLFRMRNKYFILPILVLFCVKIYGQTINYNTKDNLSKKFSIKATDELKKYETSDMELIIILPIRNSNGEITKESDGLAESIAHQLNIALSDKRLKFQAKSYTDDPLIVAELNKTSFEISNSEDYYKNLIEKFKPDYLLSGFYSFDEVTENVILENVKLYNNYLDANKTDFTIISIENITTEQIGGSYIPILKSAVLPGWGQFHKNRKFKGAFFMTTETIALSGALTFNYLSVSKFNDAVASQDFGDLIWSNDYATTRNYFLIGAAVIYGVNILDVIVSKTKINKPKSVTYFENNFQLYPYYASNSVGFSLTLKIN